MATLDREKARQVLIDSALGTDLDVVLDGLEECVELDGWNAIMRILGTYYPESIFPPRSIEADWGNGPQVVSLLRLLRAAEERLARIAALCAESEQSAADYAAQEYERKGYPTVTTAMLTTEQVRAFLAPAPIEFT